MGAASGGASYFYDGDARRVKKIVAGPTAVITVFVYDIGGQLIAEYSDQQPTASGTSYLTTDHLGTPRVITKADAAVSGRHDYQPFGEEIESSVGGRAGVVGYLHHAGSQHIILPSLITLPGKYPISGCLPQSIILIVMTPLKTPVTAGEIPILYLLPRPTVALATAGP